MFAILVCIDRDCRAAFEADGRRDAIAELRCEDCGGDLQVAEWAAPDPSEQFARPLDVRRAA